VSYSLGMLGATQYVIPSGGSFTGMFNVRGLASGGAASASAAIGVEVRTIRGVTFNYIGWGSGADAGVVVAKGNVSSDTVPGQLLSQLRSAATRAKTRIVGSPAIDVTIRHVPTVAQDVPSSTPSSSTTAPPSSPTYSEPFYSQSVFGLPVWLLGVIGLGGLATFLIMGRKRKTPAAVAAPALAKNRRRRRLKTNSRLRRKRPSPCKTCKHHRSIHEYDPADGGRKEPAWCRVPGCKCTQYVRKSLNRNWRGSRRSALPPLRRVN